MSVSLLRRDVFSGGNLAYMHSANETTVLGPGEGTDDVAGRAMTVW